jgi:hypothetical protein
MLSLALYGDPCRSKDRSFKDDYLIQIKTPTESETFCEAYGKFANAEYLLNQVFRNPKKARVSGVSLNSVETLTAIFGAQVLKSYSPFQEFPIACSYKMSSIPNCWGNVILRKDRFQTDVERIKRILSH